MTLNILEYSCEVGPTGLILILSVKKYTPTEKGLVLKYTISGGVFGN
jgi:hypothetical protein